MHVYMIRETEMVTHSSILAWKIPWMEVAMGLQSRTRLGDFTFFHYDTYMNKERNITAILEEYDI